MRRLTLRELNAEHNGRLPADAVLHDDEGEPGRRADSSKKRKPISRSERFATLNAFADCTLANLTGAEAKVWLVLYRDTRAKTGTARTGQADIARRAGLTVRGVQKAIVALAAKNLLYVVRRGRLNTGCSTYRLHPTGNA